MSQRRPKTHYWQDAPQPRDQLVLFAETLEQRIPEDHPVRILDEVLSSLDWQEWEATYHGKIGQPPIHPSVMCKVLLFGLIRRIRSTRQLEYNLRHSIDFMWLASGRTIDHSTLSEFRRKYENQVKGVYRQVILVAINLGVAKLAELCIDGTRVRANASRFRTLTLEKVERLLEELNQQISDAMSELETNDTLDELFDSGERTDQLPPELRDMKTRQEELKDALAQLQEMEQTRRHDGKRHSPSLPVTDLTSRILPNKEGGYAANYTPMAIAEMENGFIASPDVLVGNVEHLAMTPMLDEIEQDYGQTVNTTMADGVYCTGKNLQEMEERGIELLSPIESVSEQENPAFRDDPTIPVADEDLDRLPLNPQTKRFDKQAFVYDEELDFYYCPAGKKVPREGTEKVQRSGATVERTNYRCHECQDCPLIERCRTNPKAKQGRRVTRDCYEPARQRHRVRMRREDARERYKQRQHYGEVHFAVLKTTLDFRRFLLRGIAGVRQEWRWVCMAFNLMKLMTLQAELRAEVNKPAQTLGG